MLTAIFKRVGPSFNCAPKVHFISKKTMSSSGCDASTYVFNHTMLRVRDPEISLDFYKRVMGMKLLRTSEQPAGKFTLYFLGHVKENEVIPTDEKELHTFVANRPGILELTHNWGTESNPDFKGYHNGNKEPQGY
ncbi:hypothetical protein DSO57_1003036 [Entomophthora muscae]|uniref:Uncharacterized protein n=1 Tax=Entomophthora muscae TaxID=34485 RepID=A0ACC2SXW3_9FUNG|nr:hypothetical protein DSO57_1003036 [Entomophthora muscae]